MAMSRWTSTASLTRSKVTLAQLGQENDTLKQQVEALTGGEGAPSGDAEVLQRQLNESHDEVERLAPSWTDAPRN